MRRVCIVLPKTYPQAVVSRTARALVEQGYQTDIICFQGKGQKARESANGLAIYRLPIDHRRESVFRYLFEYASFFIMAAWKLSWLSVRRPYDVVEVCTMPDFIVFSTFFARLRGSKVVLYLFEYMPELFATTFGKGDNHPGVRLLRWLERLSSRYADHVIVVCENQKRRVVQNGDIAPEKVSVVLNVPDETAFGRLPVVTARNEHVFRIITHGTLLNRQGVQTLISAVPSLTEEIPGLMVNIVGDGEYRPTLEKLAQDLGVISYVNFTGWVDPAKVPGLIAQADVGVVAHLFDLMLPHKVFEYLVLGKPVVAAGHKHMRDYFDEQTMLFFEPGNPQHLAERILSLYRDPAMRGSLALRARESYLKHSWSVTKNEYLKVYRDLLGASPT